MVTARSCIAWSSALWVLAGARLISSASRNVVKIGPLTSSERVALEVEDIRAGDVGGHQVGRELDAVEVRAEHVGERADEQRLGDAGHAFDERVLAGEDRDERLIDDLLLADDDLADFRAGGGQQALELVETLHWEERMTDEG